MAGRLRALGAGVLVLLVLLPGLAPTLAEPAPEAVPSSAAAPLPNHVGLDALRHQLAPLLPEGIARAALDRAFGSFGILGAAPLAQPPRSHGLDGPRTAEEWTGEVVLEGSRSVPGDLTIRNATVRFTRPGTRLDVDGDLRVHDTTFVGAAGEGNEVEVFRELEARRTVFERVRVDSAGHGPALVEDSVFRDASTGLQARRSDLEVRRTSFFNHSTAGVAVTTSGVADDPTLGPRILDSTFEQSYVGISVSGDVAGRYERNLARGNVFGVACTTPGAPDGRGGYHRPQFEDNNLYTNLGEAIAGVRGITIVTPIGTFTIPNSGCDHDHAYLGPAGNARDSVFLSTDDTLTDVAASPNPSDAPPLPAPLREVTTAETWGPGPVVLDGPVVVNAPGDLRIHNATLQGATLLGSKVNGRFRVENSTVDPLASTVLRTVNDIVVDSALGGAASPRPVLMYRCNCTLRGNDVRADQGVGITLLGGLLTDDTTWRPSVLDNTVHGRAAGGGGLAGGMGLLAGVVSPTLRGNVFHDLGIGAVGLLSTVTLDDNDFRGNDLHLLAGIGTLTSTENVYEDALIGVISLLDTDSYTQDVFASNLIGLLPALNPPTTVTLSNFTFNGAGVLPALAVVNIATSNLFDNFLFSLVALPVELEGVDIPTGITCTGCWSPADESWTGNVTYTSGLLPNDVHRPPWAAEVTRALSGQTVDLAGVLDAPAVARSGGTLRVNNATLDLAGRFPVGAKGGGPSGGATGRLSLDNATLVNGSFVGLNSTNSRMVQSHFRGFPDAAVVASWNGGAYECLAFEDMGVAIRYNFQGPSAQRLTAERLLLEGVSGVSSGLGLSGTTGDVTILDSGILGGRLVERAQPGEVQVHRSNLLGAPRSGISDGVQDENASAIDAADNWWDDPEGPNRGGGYARWEAVEPILEPFATSAFAPAPCMAFEVRTARPADDAPVDFADRTIDASAMGAAGRTWEWGDGGAPETSDEAAASHRFPDGGSFQVELAYESASGAHGEVARAVSVAHTPPRPGFDAAVVDEVTPVAFADRSTHGNPRDAPPDGWAYRWSFGDGATSTARGPERRYADGGTYSVTLNATDDDGLAAQVSRSVLVPHVPPAAAFAVEGSLETDTFRLVDQSTHPNAPTDGVANRTWACSDGFASFAASPTHEFADGGTHACTLTVRDDDGMSSTATRAFEVQHVAPAPAFAAPGGDELHALAFVDASTHPNAPVDAPPGGWAYAWDFGDGAVSEARSPAHDYADGGTYAVTLRTTDDDGLAASVAHDVAVAHVPPDAAFGFAPEHPDPGDEVAFADASAHPNAPVDALVSWAWDFGDGDASAERDPLHAFAERGQYNVTLTVTDDDGLARSLTRRVTVGNLPPVPLFALEPEAPTDLDDVQFTDLSTDADGSVVAWAWDFGDGGASAERHPEHRWADDGTYEVALTVTDDLGAAATLRRAVEVRNVPPTPDFGLGPDDPVAGEAVQFADFSVDLDGSVVAWAWDFGDGTGSDERDPVHAFPEGGDYMVTLTATDDDGDAATATRAVHVCETGVRPAPFRVELCLRVRWLG